MAKMQFGGAGRARPAGGMRQVEQGSVQSGGVGGPGKFAPRGAYLLFVYQESAAGAATYQGIWFINAPRRDLFETQAMGYSIFAEGGSASAPSVTVDAGAVSITPRSGNEVFYTLYKMR